MRVERKNGVIRIIDPPIYVVLASDAQAKALAVELYKMSDGGGDGTVTITDSREGGLPMSPPK